MALDFLCWEHESYYGVHHVRVEIRVCYSVTMDVAEENDDESGGLEMYFYAFRRIAVKVSDTGGVVRSVMNVDFQ